MNIPFIRKESSRRAAQIRGLTFGILTFIISNALIYWATKDLSSSANFIVSLLAGLIAYLIPIAVQQANQQESTSLKIADELARLTAALGSTIVYQGTLSEILHGQNSKIVDLIRKSKEVRNTLIYYNTQRDKRKRIGIDNNSPVNESTIPNRMKYIDAALAEKCRWIDIYSKNTLREMNSGINELTKKFATHYSAWVLRKDHPAVNMTLFANKSEQFSEVWFGFGLLDDIEDGPIYSTSEPRLIQYFEAYFKSLKDKSRLWLSESPDHIPGAWVSVSFDEVTNELIDIAINKISVSDSDSDYVIAGKIYKPLPNEKLELMREFQTIFANFIVEDRRPSIYFSHKDIYSKNTKAKPKMKAKEKDDKRWGGGRYQFLSEENFTEYSGNVYAINGEGKEIFGRKLSIENLKKIETDGGKGIEYVSLVKKLLAHGAISNPRPIDGTSPFQSSPHFFNGPAKQ